LVITPIPQVLLVEDTAELSLWMGTALRQAGMSVDIVVDGDAALKQLTPGHRFDAVVLDLNIPGPDGLEVLDELRARDDDVPVLILSARASVPDRVLGLNLGADDYLPKPFELSELEARLAVLLRRRQRAMGEVLRFGPLTAGVAKGEILFEGRPLALTPRESSALKALMRSVPKTMSKERLHEEVFGVDGSEPEAVEVLVHRLRKKLDAQVPALTQQRVSVTTFRGLGYLLTLKRTD
jgi:two-component system, OmpR family, response regulator TctD